MECLNVGQIVNVHGLKGEVKVYPLTDDIERFKKLKTVYIEKNKELMPHKILNVKFVKNLVVLKLEGVDTIEQAQKMRDSYIQIDRAEAIALPEDSYFICDLIGIDVYETNGNYLGKVADVIPTGANDVYIVRNGDAEILIPALFDIFKLVDIKNRRIEVALLEGLK